MKRQLLLMLLLCMSFAFANAQSVTVKGRVTEKGTDAPMPGVQVTLKSNQKVVTTTDETGAFTLTVPSLNVTLLFHSMEHKDMEVNVQGNSFTEVKMEKDVTGSMEEVIIVGVAVKKKDLTGSVATISSEKIAQTPTTSINQAIQGKMPGARVTSSSSPGSDAQIKIRGNNSIQYGTNPIYVVDGAILDGGFNSLNPDDIASVDVLKDASATAIYGSRGANGVVLITTKKGKKGEGKITYNGWVGWQSFTHKMKLMNANDIWDLRIDAFGNKAMEDSLAKNPSADGQNIYNMYVNSVKGNPGQIFAPYEINTHNQDQSYDWLDAVTRTGIEQNHSLAFSGGSDKGSYFLSFNYADQKGIILNSDYQRYGGRVNIEQNVKSWLKVGTNTTYSRTTEDLVDGTVFSAAVTANPLLPVDTANTYLKWASNYDNNAYNPYKSLEIQNNKITNRLLSSNYININPIKDLNIRSTFSINLADYQLYLYQPTTTGQSIRNKDNGIAKQQKGQSVNWQWDNTASYFKRFGNHSLTAMVGASLTKNDNDTNNVTVTQFYNDLLSYYNLSGGANVRQNELTSIFVTNTMASFYGRVDYSYKNKYFASGTLRYDGTSKLSRGQQWGLFPSIALSWDMAKEDFMSSLTFVNRLKWRVGYGITGNQNIPDYAYYSLFAPKLSNGQIGFPAPTQMGNHNLKWERQKQFNAGFDLDMFENRLSIKADYFNIKNDQLLMLQNIDPFYGALNQVANVGAMTNNGIELNVSYVIMQKKDLQWSVWANLSADRNKVTKLYGKLPYLYNYGGYSGTEIQRTGNLFIGESINNIYTYKFKKIAQQATIAQDTAGMNFGGRMVHPGDIIVVDQNGDHKIDDADKSVVGKLDPKFYGGFGTDVMYKGFGLTVFFNYSSGAKRISGFYEGMMSSAGMSAAHKDMLDRWTPEHTNTNVPRAVYGASRFGPGDCDWGIQNASFLRLSTLTLSYMLPQSVLKSAKIDNAKVYFTGTNLLLSTKDKGYDPETGDNYPNARTLTLGINVSL